MVGAMRLPGGGVRLGGPGGWRVNVPIGAFFFAVTAVMGLFSAVRCLSVGVFSY